MTLRRSASSLRSLHRFYGAEVVVFCEGGPTRTVSEALSTHVDGSTLDTIFWSTMVQYLAIPKNCHFKSVGNKHTLISIAMDVEINDVSTVTVCLDSDYDILLGESLSIKRVIYTCGYSWENDIISLSVIQNVLSQLIGPIPVEINRAVQRTLEQLENDLARWCEIDIALRAKRKPSVFNREKPLNCVDMTNNPPCLKHSALKAQLQACGYVRRPKRIVHVNASMSMRVAFGKLIGRLIYHIVVALLKQAAPGIRISYDLFMRLAIANAFTLAGQGHLPTVAAHYSAQRHAF